MSSEWPNNMAYNSNRIYFSQNKNSSQGFKHSNINSNIVHITYPEIKGEFSQNK